MNTFQIPRVSSDPAIEAENFRLHTIHDAGYEARYDGLDETANEYTVGTIEHDAWEAGYEQAGAAIAEYKLSSE